MILTMCFVFVASASNYKSFAELHPQISQRRDMPELGIIKIKNGLQYTALAEAKKLNIDAWFQTSLTHRLCLSLMRTKSPFVLLQA